MSDVFLIAFLHKTTAKAKRSRCLLQLIFLTLNIYFLNSIWHYSSIHLPDCQCITGLWTDGQMQSHLGQFSDCSSPDLHILNLSGPGEHANRGRRSKLHKKRPWTEIPTNPWPCEETMLTTVPQCKLSNYTFWTTVQKNLLVLVLYTTYDPTKKTVCSFSLNPLWFSNISLSTLGYFMAQFSYWVC